MKPRSCFHSQLVLVRACTLSQIPRLSRTGCQAARLLTQSTTIRASTQCPTPLSYNGRLFPYVAPSLCKWHPAGSARVSSDRLRVRFAESVSSSASFGPARNDRLPSCASAALSASGSVLSTAASRQFRAANPHAILSSAASQRCKRRHESTGSAPAYRYSLQILQKAQGMLCPCRYSKPRRH